jgi:4a-hydroxytetrahydrobiopterin dehydratase
MVYEVLSEEALAQALAELDGWRIEDGKLSRSFVFNDFVSAFGWMTAAALVAERMNHHPEWFNVYNRVEVSLQTHDVTPPAITDRDVTLARAMQALALR